MSGLAGADTGSRALVLAPHGRDAAVAARLLQQTGTRAVTVDGGVDLLQSIDDETWFVVVTEEALLEADLRMLRARLAAQPSWSDLPFLVLTHRNPANDQAGMPSLFEWLGNVTLLERPFRAATFVSAARSARKGRERQYQARAHIEALHEGEQRLHTALLAGRLGAWELEASSGTLSTSQTCRTVFGCARGSLDWESLVAAIHPQDRGRVREASRGCLQGRGDLAVEFRTLWPDGSVHWAEMRACLMPEWQGRPARLVGVCSDVTERKTAEAQLRRLNETLEERVAERTAALEKAHADVLAEIGQRERAEDQLRQSQKMEMLGQLTGGIAHDFNNLLMAILGNMDMLQKHVRDNPSASRLIESALTGARRGANLTQRLLAFARRQSLKVTPGDMIELVDGMRELVQHSAGSGVELHFELPDRVRPALMDTNQVELALLNLVVNARDAMPRGGVLTIAVDEAEVDVPGELMPGPHVRLSVSDTGIGMDAETLARATEPFFSTKDVGKGTGLGLSMIHGLARQLNGVLRLASEPGRGTRAELWLPATTQPAERSAPLGALPAEVSETRRRILVVDDDALVAMSTVDMLEDLGHDVLQATSGPKALEILLGGAEIDLLITDYMMPRMNGAELARAVRELRPDLPILLSTGFAEVPQGVELELPRIGKPYLQAQLAAEIGKLLGRRVSP